VAYAVRDWPYLLNVPAGRLSADSRDPLQFLRFAQRFNPDADAEDFLPRELYGHYLEEILRDAERGSSSQIRLTKVAGEVVRIARSRGSLELHLAHGDFVAANRVVLAVGNPPPGDMAWSSAIRDHPAYRSDPWTRPSDLGPDKTVVIVGSGLTMADIAVSLTADLERAPRLVSISRHGLTPLPQSRFHAATPGGDVATALAGAGSVRELLAIVRGLARESAARGGDWREVITAVRNVAPRLWQRLPQAERRRFLRHLRSYWDVHRHRVPSEMAERLELIREAGKLDIIAGRIAAVEPQDQRLSVTWRSRGSEQMRTLEADLVVNATGPEMSLERSPDPLVKSLREAGWIAQDELALGLRTAPNGACISADGAASEHLFYVGPMLRAAFWEATAATELRDHAERLAASLAGHP
jgi:uncharacterized NAD(P)/FAD-binding protein YdhS